MITVLLCRNPRSKNRRPESPSTPDPDPAPLQGKASEVLPLLVKEIRKLRAKETDRIRQQRKR